MAMSLLLVFSFFALSCVNEANGNMDWTGLKISLEEGAMDGTMEEIKEEFGNLLSFKKVGGSSLSRSTMPNIYVGAEVPFLNEKMSVGALFSSRSSYNYSRNELTISSSQGLRLLKTSRLNTFQWHGDSISISDLQSPSERNDSFNWQPLRLPLFYPVAGEPSMSVLYSCLPLSRR